jgi:hypothetical protein
MSALARQFLESGSDADVISELKSSVAAHTVLDRAISSTALLSGGSSIVDDNDADATLTTDEEFILSIVDDKLHGPYEEEKIIKVRK